MVVTEKEVVRARDVCIEANNDPARPQLFAIATVSKFPNFIQKPNNRNMKTVRY